MMIDDIGKWIWTTRRQLRVIFDDIYWRKTTPLRIQPCIWCSVFNKNKSTKNTIPDVFFRNSLLNISLFYKNGNILIFHSDGDFFHCEFLCEFLCRGGLHIVTGLIKVILHWISFTLNILYMKKNIQTCPWYKRKLSHFRRYSDKNVKLSLSK